MVFAFVVLVLAAVMLASCSNELAVDPPQPVAEVAEICESLTSQLPESVEREIMREVEPSSPLTAAWGSPAIILRCGVGVPDSYEPTSQVATVNGVDWFPEELAEGYVFTTWGRIVNVEVTVPDDYAPEVNPLVDLAPAIKDTVPKTPR